MTDQYTEISFNAGETLKASQLNTVVQNINIVNTQVENINHSITDINTAVAGKADKPAGNESYATTTYVNTTVATGIGNKVDKTTTINNKALNSNITLSAADVGAAKASDLTTLQTNLATLQTNFANLQTSLNLSAGRQNQFAVSNGSGGITWLEIPNAEDTTY